MLNIVVVSPMPNVNATIATSVSPGLLASERNPWQMSRKMACIVEPAPLRTRTALVSVERVISMGGDSPSPVRERKAVQHHAVDDADHRRRQSDPERKRADRDGREPRAHARR